MTLQPGGKPLKWLKLRTQGLGSDEVRMWQDLHFSGSATHVMQLILVERILPEQSHSKPQPLWLVWVGKEMLTLSEIWRQYLRRESY